MKNVDLTIPQIQQRLSENSRSIGQTHFPAGKSLRRAAVLIPLLKEKGEWHLLYTRRSDELTDHRGQVAFPGGAVDPEDRHPEDTALREAREEVGLLPSTVELLGRMGEYRTISNYVIIPVVGVVQWPFEIALHAAEVSRAFTIPLRWLANPEHFEVRAFKRPDGFEHPVLFFEPYDGELLWGITAEMTHHFLQTLGLL